MLAMGSLPVRLRCSSLHQETSLNGTETNAFVSFFVLKRATFSEQETGLGLTPCLFLAYDRIGLPRGQISAERSMSENAAMADLIARLRVGDAQAAAEFVRHYEPAIRLR